MSENQALPPIDMVLHCPACGMQHIDAPDLDPCKDGCRMARDYGFLPSEGHRCSTACGYMQPGSPRWTNPPHRSHLCHGCGRLWRPADVPTNGVAAVKTKGKADSPIVSRHQDREPAGYIAVNYSSESNDEWPIYFELHDPKERGPQPRQGWKAVYWGPDVPHVSSAEVLEWCRAQMSTEASRHQDRAAADVVRDARTPAEATKSGRELPDDIRVPLHRLWADAGYLVGRAINGDRDLAVHTIRSRCDELERAILALPPAEAKPVARWVPVTERLPAEHQPVLLWANDEISIRWAVYWHGASTGFAGWAPSDDPLTNATHWMPLPPPPAEINP